MTDSADKITLHDMSLRDGMHPKRHQISIEQMVDHCREAWMTPAYRLIEVTHGDGLGGASVNYGFPAHSDEEYLKLLWAPLSRQKFQRC